MSIVYKELLNNTIQKLSASLKRPNRLSILVNTNGHQSSAPFDTGPNMCCMMATKFRQVLPVGKRPKKCNLINNITAASGDITKSKGVYPIPFEIDKKKFVYNVHGLKNLCDVKLLPQSRTCLWSGNQGNLLVTNQDPSGRLPTSNALPRWWLSQPATNWSPWM